MDRWTERTQRRTREREEEGKGGEQAKSEEVGKVTKESHGQKWLEFVLLITHGVEWKESIY